MRLKIPKRKKGGENQDLSWPKGEALSGHEHSIGEHA